MGPEISLAGKVGDQGFSAYAKGATALLSRVLGKELIEDGVKKNGASEFREAGRSAAYSFTNCRIGVVFTLVTLSCVWRYRSNR